MGLRICLVEPRPPGHHVYDKVLLPRLGLPLIGTMLVEAGHDVTVYCDALSPVDVSDCLAADVVGISSTTATVPSAYRLADVLESAGVAVVMGGPHVTFRPGEALEHARWVVRGEGEQTMLELVAAAQRDADLDQVAGLSWRAPSGQVHHNPARPRCSQAAFEALPAPDLTLIVGHQQMSVKPLMTQWGCPYDCEFCSVTAMFSRRVRHRRTGQVLAELAGLDADRVFFHDDNFVVNKDRTAQLLRAMVDRGVTPEWFAQVRADTIYRSHSRRDIDEDFLRLMRAAGCRMVMIGFESISDAGLAGLGKRESVADSERAVDAFHDHGIGVHGMFVLGLDTDGRESAGDTVRFAKRLGIDTIQMMMETPLPGTRLWNRVAEEGRLLDADWSLFDGHHAVMRPAGMSPLELQLSVLEAMKRFYSWPSVASAGVLAAIRELPALARVLIRPSFASRLPDAGMLALRGRWRDLGRLVYRTLGPDEFSRIASAFTRPVLRGYGRHQLTAWQAQEQTRAHQARLALLAAAESAG